MELQEVDMAGLDENSVLGKAMRILHAFTAEDHGLGFAELQRRTGMPKATLHRQAADLVAAGLLDRVDGQYQLGSHLFELGMLASVERTLIDVAMPFLEDLYERTHEVVHLARREGAEVVYVAKVTGHRGVRAPSRVGGRMPLHATAIGKALLAHAGQEEWVRVLSGQLERRTAHTITAPGRLRQQLDGVLTNGVAYENEEGTLGVVCVAAPILDPDDHPIAAVSIAGHPARFKPSVHAASVRAAAAGIAATLAQRAELAAGAEQ